MRLSWNEIPARGVQREFKDEDPVNIKASELTGEKAEPHYSVDGRFLLKYTAWPRGQRFRTCRASVHQRRGRDIR